MPVEAQRVTMQMLNDVGLNPFALRLVAECFTRRKDFAEWTGPITFIFDGLEFTIRKAEHSTAVPESAPKEQE